MFIPKINKRNWELNGMNNMKCNNGTKEEVRKKVM